MPVNIKCNRCNNITALSKTYRITPENMPIISVCGDCLKPEDPIMSIGGDNYNDIMSDDSKIIQARIEKDLDAFLKDKMGMSAEELEREMNLLEQKSGKN